MTLRKEIEGRMKVAIRFAKNDDEIEMKYQSRNIEVTTDQICSLIKERLEDIEPLGKSKFLDGTIETKEDIWLIIDEFRDNIDNLIKELS